MCGYTRAYCVCVCVCVCIASVGVLYIPTVKLHTFNVGMQISCIGRVENKSLLSSIM